MSHSTTDLLTAVRERIKCSSPEALIIRNNTANRFFFSAETMEFFDSMIHLVAEIAGTDFIITSEQDSHGAWNGERRYTIRVVNETGEVGTVGEFGQFYTLADAITSLGFYAHKGSF